MRDFGPGFSTRVTQVLSFVVLVPLISACSLFSTERHPIALDVQAQAEIGAEVRQFLFHYIQTLEGSDEKAIESLFVPDDRFTWFTDGEQSYASPAEVLAGMRRYAGISFRTTISEIMVIPLTPAQVWASSKFQTELVIPNADDYHYGGVITWLLEKNSSSGEWHVVTGHTSTPGGPPGRE